MNFVYLRFAFYVIAPALGTLPGIQYVPDTQQLVIDIETALAGMGAAIIASGGIFAKWGKK
jgi:hypothetical protein